MHREEDDTSREQAIRADGSDLFARSYVRSENVPHMSMRDRAAQFAPFAALTGYEEILKEVQSVSERLQEKGQAADYSDCQYLFHSR